METLADHYAARLKSYMDSHDYYNSMEWLEKLIIETNTNRIRLLEKRLEELEAKLKNIKALVAFQAEDEGLWFIPIYAPESHLQQELRKLHAMIEGE
jgi:hypothetical protein